MKTTLDLPDALMREVKIRAVHERKKLKDAINPSEREMAAMTLALSDARNTPEVLDALAIAAQTDRQRDRSEAIQSPATMQKTAP